MHNMIFFLLNLGIAMIIVWISDRITQFYFLLNLLQIIPFLIFKADVSGFLIKLRNFESSN